MDLSSGYPYWLIKNGLPYNYPFLENNIATDVLIMGGGISGALMAYSLVNAGVKCTLIDSRSIGLGSTCASTSLLQYELDTPLFKLAEKIGKANAFAAYQQCYAAVDKLEKIAVKLGFAAFTRTKSLYFAAAKKDVSFLQKELTARKECGFDVSFLDEKDIKKHYGFSSPGAIVSQQGAQADVYNFTHAILQHSIKKGLRVYDRTQGLVIKHTKNKVLVTTEKNCTIKTNHLVYATGYEVLKYIDDKYVKLKSTYAVCSEQMNPKYLKHLQGNVFWNTADPYLYMRLTGDNRILVGGRDEDFYDPAKRDKMLPAKVKLLVKDFKKLFPAMPFKPEFSWAGTFAGTEDSLPFIGKYKNIKNSYFSLGFGGNGIIFSLIGAEIITDIITGKKNKQEQLFSFDRI